MLEFPRVVMSWGRFVRQALCTADVIILHELVATRALDGVSQLSTAIAYARTRSRYVIVIEMNGASVDTVSHSHRGSLLTPNLIPMPDKLDRAFYSPGAHQIPDRNLVFGYHGELQFHMSMPEPACLLDAQTLTE